MRNSFCRELCSQRLSWLRKPTHKFSCGLLAVYQSSFHGNITGVRSLLPLGTDYSDWMIYKKFCLVLNVFFVSSLWSWFCHVVFWSCNCSHNWGQCTGPVVLVYHSLSKPAVGVSAQRGAGTSPPRWNAGVLLTWQSYLIPSLSSSSIFSPRSSPVGFTNSLFLSSSPLPPPSCNLPSSLARTIAIVSS